MTFTIIVIVLHEKVVVFVFEYRFHVYKIDSPGTDSQYLNYTKIKIFIKNQHFLVTFFQFKTLNYTLRIIWSQALLFGAKNNLH